MYITHLQGRPSAWHPRYRYVYDVYNAPAGEAEGGLARDRDVALARHRHRLLPAARVRRLLRARRVLACTRGAFTLGVLSYARRVIAGTVTVSRARARPRASACSRAGYVSVCVCMYMIYIYLYRERERERERWIDR